MKGQKLVAFSNASAKRSIIFNDALGGKLERLCDTRWVEMHDDYFQFQGDIFVKICDALTEISTWQDNKSASDANILLHALQSPDLIIAFAQCTRGNIRYYLNTNGQKVCIPSVAAFDDEHHCMLVARRMLRSPKQNALTALAPRLQPIPAMPPRDAFRTQYTATNNFASPQ
ncbi:hypothetical protein JTB14_035322 [Gonioctena quinquepunctata]|nr:hypothetical protein JTB14_035322 [Gonioctena quinquepunctata]